MAAIGCDCPVDSLILEHTEKEIQVDRADYMLLVLFEDSGDVSKSSFTLDDILDLQQLMYQHTLREEYKSLTVWVAHDMQTWDSVMDLDPHKTPSTNIFGAFTVYTSLDSFVVLISPVRWCCADRQTLARLFLHEMIHWIESSHENLAYYGDNGLIQEILDEWVAQDYC